MTLLITTIAAVIATFAWYRNAPEDTYRVRVLCFLYWGASLMWLVDAVVEYIEVGAEYFRPAPLDMLNDAFLGVSVVTLGLVVWIVNLLVHDPRGVIKAALRKSKEETPTAQEAITENH